MGTRIFNITVIIVAIMLSSVLVSCSTMLDVSSPKVKALKCEYQQNPLGVEKLRPRLNWQLQSPFRGAKQTAYHILVASSPAKLKKGKADLWDSGKVQSDQSTHVEYTGKPLTSQMECFWKVRIWDQAGKASRWSSVNRWSMGMLNATDWKADWIGARKENALSDMGNGFRSLSADSEDTTKWVQIDLGKTEKIERITLLTIKFIDTLNYGNMGHQYKGGNLGFPKHFYIEVADNAEMKNATRVVDYSQGGYKVATWPHCRCVFKMVEEGTVDKGGSDPGAKITDFKPGKGPKGRYVRMTATKLRREGGEYWFGLAEMQVFSPIGRNLAERAVVSASDSLETKRWSAQNLTKYFKTEGSKAVMLRKEIELKTKPVRATAYMSGLGTSELYLNGKNIGDRKLDPADTDYRKRVMYVTHDVTDTLSKGKNAIGVILGNGWFDINFRDIWDFEGSSWAEPKKLLLQIELEFADGSKQTVVSDKSWKWSTGEIIYNSIRGGESIDARKAQPGWKHPQFNDSKWKPALKLPAPKGFLKSQQHVPIRVVKQIRPVKLIEPVPGIYVYDMGQNFSGWVRFRASGKKGQIIQLNFEELLMRFAEQLNLKENKFQWATAAMTYSRYQTGEFILSGKGEDIYEPRFTYHSFQYVQVAGLSGTRPVRNTDGHKTRRSLWNLHFITMMLVRYISIGSWI